MTSMLPHASVAAFQIIKLDRDPGNREACLACHQLGSTFFFGNLHEKIGPDGIG